MRTLLGVQAPEEYVSLPYLDRGTAAYRRYAREHRDTLRVGQQMVLFGDEEEVHIFDTFSQACEFARTTGRNGSTMSCIEHGGFLAPDPEDTDEEDEVE